MVSNPSDNWKAITGLVGEIKRCEECGVTTAAVAMAFICIDTLAALSRPENKEKVTRSDFKDWINTYLKGHLDQPYQYRGKDIYAARCAFLHTYGSVTELHLEDSDIIKFGYHDGGRHVYNPDTHPNFAIIGTKSFINDVIHAANSFLKACQNDDSLRSRVESRLPDMFQTMPFPSQARIDDASTAS